MQDTDYITILFYFDFKFCVTQNENAKRKSIEN